MPAAAIAAMAVVAAGTTAYGAYNASQAKSEAIDEKGKQEKLQEQAIQKAEAERKSNQALIDAKIAGQEATKAANAQRLADQKKKNIGGGGLSSRKGGTLLTGPLGLQGNAPGAVSGQKTLLGQ